ncbi:MAG: helix-turn-helix domain-containing protein [Acutalibacteraceae bacterium]
MTFGETFKSFRKKFGYTQEQTAAYLMVSAQAVSKWENGLAAPDISLLVPIAELFGTTTDILLGKSDEKSRETILFEISEIADMRVHGKKSLREIYALYENMLRQNPNNADILYRLLITANQMIEECGDLSDKEKDAILKNSKKRAEQIRKLGEGDNEYRQAAHGVMAGIYTAVGDYDNAEKEIDMLPNGAYTKARKRGQMYYMFSRYDDCRVHLREAISDELTCLCSDMDLLAMSYLESDRKTMDGIYKSIYGIIHAVFGDDKCPVPVQYYLATASIRLAQRAAWENDTEMAMNYISEFMESLRTQRQMHNKKLTNASVVLPEVMQPYRTPSVRPGYYGDFAVSALNWHAFDRLRNDESFIAYADEAQSWYEHAEG